MIEMVNGLQLIATIFFLVWFFYGPWNKFMVDLARQNLFEIRDEIFIMAAQGDLDFSSSLYQVLRSRLNGMIRYCHTITLFSIFTAYTFSKSDPRTEKLNLLLQIRSLEDKEVARLLERKYHQAFYILIGTLVLRSGILCLGTILLSPLMIIISLMKDSSKRLKILQITRQAVEYDLEQEAGSAIHNPA